MKRKKLLKTAFAVLILFVLLSAAAWAGGGQEQTGDQKPIVITMWFSVGGNPRRSTEVLAERFNQSQSEIVMEAVYSGSYEDTTQKLLAAAVAGNSPTIAHMAHCYAPQLVKAGHIEALDEIIERDPTITKEDYVPALYNANVYQGQNYGVPYNCSNPVMFYNKELFRQAGLDPEKTPATWEETYQYAAKIQKTGGEIYGMNIDRMSGWISQGFVWQFGGEWIKADNSTVLWDDPASVEALRYMQKMVNDGIAVYRAELPAFVSGQVGMYIRSTGLLAQMIDTADFDFGVGIQPQKVRQMVPIGGGSLYMSKGLSGEEKAAAWEFMKFVTNPVNQMFWAKSTGYMAANTGSVASTEMNHMWSDDPRRKVTYDQLPYSRPEDHTWLAPFLQVRDIFNEAWDDTVLNNLDPKERLAEAQVLANKILAEAK